MAGQSGQETETFLLGGGLDLVTPALGIAAGRAISALNYEPDVRGYRRIAGYERYDGRMSPSEADYLAIDYEDGTTGLAAFATVYGELSEATGIVATTPVVTSGSLVAGTAAGTVELFPSDGTFVDNDILYDIGTAPLVFGGVTLVFGGETLTLLSNVLMAGSAVLTAGGSVLTTGAIPVATIVDIEALNVEDVPNAGVVNAARTLIQPVPGSGPVRGVAIYNGSVYAWRDNVGATAGIMHKATVDGWVAQSFGHTIAFTTGSIAFVEGDTVNGQTSGATATVRRVIASSGTYGGSNAAGYLVLSGITGTFQNGENLRKVTTVHAVASSAAVAITLPPGGIYETKTHNFYGAADRKRLYIVNGVGPAHEWDGTVLAPIQTGLSTDLEKPTHIAEKSEHLFLGYRGGAITYSGVGEPLIYRVDAGAGTLSIGQDITALIGGATTTLAVFSLGKSAVISGTDATTFKLEEIAEDAGAVEWTGQLIGMPTYLDTRGVRRLETTQDFGGWRAGTLTSPAQPIFDNKRKIRVRARASIRVRGKDQYRLFWDDGTGLTIYLGRKVPETLPFEYPMIVRCSCSDYDENDDEMLLVGSDDGYVYELDKGTSFDGASISALLRLPFNSLKSPSREKRFHKVTLEIDGSSETSIGVSAEFGYASNNVPPFNVQDFSVRGGGGFWNEADWNEFYWSSPVQGIAEAWTPGIGQNISVAILSQSDTQEPHTLSAMTLNYSFRKQKR